MARREGADVKQTYILAHDEARQRAIAAVMAAPDGMVVEIGELGRTKDQNAAMWPVLDAFAKQRQWTVNGRLEWIADEEWKDLLTANYTQEAQRISPALSNSGMVMLGLRTREFKRKAFYPWLDYLHAMAAEFEIVVPLPKRWSEQPESRA